MSMGGMEHVTLYAVRDNASPLPDTQIPVQMHENGLSVEVVCPFAHVCV